MSDHSFDPDVAKQVGVNAAVIYKNICFWVDKNEANKKHWYQDRNWTYNSIKAFTTLFPYLSGAQIRTALNKLIASELIIKGNFNQTAYDRTIWYSYYSQTHLCKSENGVVNNDKPIPDINTDINTDTKNTKKDLFGSEDKPETSVYDRAFDKLWKHISNITPKDKMGRHSKKKGLAKFKAICTRKTDAVPPGRLLNALLWFYDTDDQTKNDCTYMKGLLPVLNGELYEPFLADGSYIDRNAPVSEEDLWRERAAYCNKNDGYWMPSWKQESLVPVPYREFFDKKHWRKFGWKAV